VSAGVAAVAASGASLLTVASATTVLAVLCVLLDRRCRRAVPAVAAGGWALLLLGLAGVDDALWSPMAGVAIVVTRGTWSALSQLHFVPGDAYMVVAIMGWAVYSWLLVRPPPSMQAPRRPDWDWASFLFVQIVFGLVTSGAAAAAEAAAGRHAPVAWGSASVWWALAFVAIGPSLIAYRSWGLGVARAGPTLAAFFVNLSPLFTALLSAWLLGEWPQPYHGVAFMLIVAGIVVSARRTA
jgi:drug/metabolite transporter (DMT)-like permease